jgi:hypothetical protein
MPNFIFLLVTFPSGPPPPEMLAPTAEASTRLNFELSSAKKNKKLKVSTEKMVYEAKSGEPSLSNYIVGVYDKKTEVVQLADVQHMFKMKQTAIASLSDSVKSNSTEVIPSHTFSLFRHVHVSIYYFLVDFCGFLFPST